MKPKDIDRGVFVSDRVWKQAALKGVDDVDWECYTGQHALEIGIINRSGLVDFTQLNLMVSIITTISHVEARKKYLKSLNPIAVKRYIANGRLRGWR